MSRHLTAVVFVITTVIFSVSAFAAGLPLALPATGQTISYAADDDGILKRGLAWPAPRFSDNGNSSVTDGLTGFTWPIDFNYIGTVKDVFDNDGTAKDGLVTWQHALEYVAKLNTANYLGYSDWRLPNVNELRSLLDLSRVTPALSYSNPFLNVANNAYWTSSSYDADRTQAWYMDMNIGTVSVTAKTGNYYLVPVRGGVNTFAETAATVPQITIFTMPATYTGLTVPINQIGYLDNGDITGYFLSESSTPPAATDTGWLAYQPTRFTFAAAGANTLYLFIKDAAGNVSAAASSAVTVTAFSGYRTDIRSDLASTGQTVSYATGDDSDLKHGVKWPLPRFLVNKTFDLVDDSVTGFTWPIDFNYIGTVKDVFDNDGTAKDGLVTWQHALEYVAKLNTANYLGYSDWRLPNVNELRSLLDLSRVTPALSYSHPFLNVANNAYWTSSSYDADHTQAWYMDMNIGTVSVTAKTGNYYLVPVRSGVNTFTSSDTTAPHIFSFSLPATWAGLTVPLELTTLENREVTGYWLSTSATVPTSNDSNWLEYQPTRYTFDAAGDKTLYAFAKDAAGNISTVASATVTINDVAGYRNAPRSDLPKTGQATSYASADDAASNRGTTWPIPRFVNDSGTTVEDGLTGLVWALNFNLIPTVDPAFDKDGTVNDGIVTWQHAMDFVAKLNTLAYQGSTDWRLPNVKELASLIDISRVTPSIQSGHPFLNVANAPYWTSSTYEGDHTQAWYTDLNTGNLSITAKSGVSAYLAVVRGGIKTFVGTDTLVPSIIGFSLPATWEGLRVPLIEFAAVDNVAVTGWYLSEQVTAPAAGSSSWLSAAPSIFTFSDAGTKTLYGFVKDAAGNVSPAASFTSIVTAINTTLPSQNVMQQTGQTACYDTAGTLLSSCESTGQDGMERIGVLPLAARFTKSTGYMTDSFTGLTWVRDGNLIKSTNPTFDSDGTPGDGIVTWQHALDFINQLNLMNNGAGYRNFNDWRLPTINDLKSLADYSRGSGLRKTLEDAGFTTGLADSWYWSATSYMPDPKNAWVFSMTNGSVNYFDKTTASYNTLAVRGSGSGAITYIDTDQKRCADSTGTIVSCTSTGQDGAFAIGLQHPVPRFDASRQLVFNDLLTGLVWSREGNLLRYYEPGFDSDGTAADGLVTWQHALDYVRKANQNSYLGYSDWRLPNINELSSLVSAEASSINGWLAGKAFAYVEPTPYWSSTSFDGTNAWYLDFSNGKTSYEAKTGMHPLMLVRSGKGASVASITVYKTGNGSGTISGDSGKINCGGDCFESYTSLGSSASLTAVAEVGSTFTGWSGACSGTGNCAVSLLGDIFVSASFSKPSTTTTVMDSGQTACYDSANNIVACSSTSALRGDGANITGPQLTFDRFRDNDNGTVTDLLSGLTIPKDLNLIKSRDPLFDTDVTAGDGKVTWLHAFDYIEKLNQEKYLGFSDWHLPNVREMQKFSDFSAKSALYTWNNMGLLFNHQEDWYWTSTTQESSHNNAWLFAPNSGATTTTGKGGVYYVLPVREGNGIATAIRTGQTTCSDSAGTAIPCSGTGQDADTLRGEVWPNPRFTAGSDTLIDQATGLEWPIDANLMLGQYNADASFFDTDAPRDGAVSWQKAMLFINQINTDKLFDYSDWRLPTITELSTLTNYGVTDTGMWLKSNGSWFMNLFSNTYWSSTTWSQAPTQGWYINLLNGAINTQAKATASYVLPVRGGTGFGVASLVVVKSGSGSGAVSSQQSGGISCGTNCYAAYPTAGTSVTLIATPESGSTFLGWSGGGCSGTAPCTLAVNNSMVVSALFGQSGATLPTIEIPQTGQSVCYSSAGAVTACASSGQDGLNRAGVMWPYPRFEPNQDGLSITDKLTGLVFPKTGNTIKINEPSFDLDGTTGDGLITWQHALDYIAILNSSAYLGKNDWRMPSINELLSLVNRDKANTADWLKSAEGGFSDVQNNYWSSTSNATTATQAWTIDLNLGTSTPGTAKSGTSFLFPVRGGAIGSGRLAVAATGQTGCFDSAGLVISCSGSGQDGELRSGVKALEVRFAVTAATGMISDSLTKLIWPINAFSAGPAACVNTGKIMTWDQGIAHVLCLNNTMYLGRTDWRLPNSNELATLMNRGMKDSSIWLMQNGFEQMGDPYWTSTTSPTTLTNAMSIDSVGGAVSQSSKSGALRVIPVAGGTLGTASSLHVFPSGSGTGTVSSAPAGISCKGIGTDCDELFAVSGGSMTLTATPDAGSAFLGWLGGCSGTASTCTVTLNGEVNVTAKFGKLHPLTLNKIGGSASGTVISVPSGISCGATCSALFADTTSIKLTAQSSEGYFFDRWEGCSSADGNNCTALVSGAATVTAYFYNKPLTTTSLMLSSETILNNSTIDLTGKLTPLPDNGTSLAATSVTLTVTAPNGTVIKTEVLKNDDTGHFSRAALGGFTLKGNYTIKVAFAGNERLTASTSAVKNLLVGASAGYAVLVEGRIPNDEPGLQSHNKTTNRIYHTLHSRGFIDDNIKYFNYNTDQSALNISVTGRPTTGAIQDAIETWAKNKMIGSPAPLYIIMVNHGDVNAFHLDTVTITPEQLNAWLNTLESGLSGTAAQNEKRIVIDGSCYSGSFIPTLSKTGRIIITSAAADEESYKGTKEPDGIRSGEFFLDTLFEQLKRGMPLKDAFDNSTQQTRIFTRKGGVSNSSGRYGDSSVQHPLLDDDGDGNGSNSLSTIQGDGSVSQGVYLGVGQSITNAATGPADITQIPATQFRDASTNIADIWLKASDASRVEAAWVEIRVPSTRLNVASGKALQVEIDLTKVLLVDPDANGTYMPLTPYYFTEAGMYELYYYTQDNLTGEKTPMVRGLVYRNKAANTPPGAVDLTEPATDAKVKTSSIFQWSAAVDVESDPITYTLEIAKEKEFTTIIHREEEIPATATYVPDGVLSDATSYHWRVKAVDQYGAFSTSNATPFSTDNTNGLPGFIKGYVRDSSSGIPVVGAKVTIGVGGSFSTLANGAYLISASPGSYTLNVTATSGYAQYSKDFTAVAGKVLNADINLVTSVKLVPTITWVQPAEITYGTALSAAQLNASPGAVEGTFIYSPVLGTKLVVGNHTLNTTFTPTDSTKYSSATASVTITVKKAIPTIVWPTPAAVTVGTVLSSTQLNATSDVAGTVVYNPAIGTIQDTAGNQTISVTFTPTDGSNYTTANTSVTLAVLSKLVPTITWAVPADITYGTALSATQLNASTSVAGTFAYSPVLDTKLAVGNQTLNVTFTPNDIATFASTTATVTIMVNKAAATVTLTGLNQNYDGAAKTVNATTTPAGLITNITYNGNATAPTVAGSYPVIATIADANYSGSATGTLIIASQTQQKPGDCNGSGSVTIDEVQSAINMFLGLKTVAVCVDINGTNSVSIDEVQKTINSFLGL